MTDTYPLTASEIKTKQAELLANQRIKRIQQVRQQEKQQALLRTQLYKENCQELARQATATSELQWENDSIHALAELQNQLRTSLATTGAGHAAAYQAQTAAAQRAKQQAQQRAAQLHIAHQRFAHALHLRHSQQTAAVQSDVTRLQRMTDTKAAESQRAHALAQQHRAEQAEAALNSTLPADTTWNDAALGNIDYRQTRLHELGPAALVQRNKDKGVTHRNFAADAAAAVQARYVPAGSTHLHNTAICPICSST